MQSDEKLTIFARQRKSQQQQFGYKTKHIIAMFCFVDFLCLYLYARFVWDSSIGHLTNSIHHLNTDFFKVDQTFFFHSFKMRVLNVWGKKEIECPITRH